MLHWLHGNGSWGDEQNPRLGELMSISSVKRCVLDLSGAPLFFSLSSRLNSIHKYHTSNKYQTGVRQSFLHRVIVLIGKTITAISKKSIRTCETPSPTRLVTFH